MRLAGRVVREPVAFAGCPPRCERVGRERANCRRRKDRLPVDPRPTGSLLFLRPFRPRAVRSGCDLAVDQAGDAYAQRSLGGGKNEPGVGGVVQSPRQ